jgi:hypothetical protein
MQAKAGPCEVLSTQYSVIDRGRPITAYEVRAPARMTEYYVLGTEYLAAGVALASRVGLRRTASPAEHFHDELKFLIDNRPRPGYPP